MKPTSSPSSRSLGKAALLPLFSGAVLACVLAPARAQDDGHIVYRLQPKDTLLTLVAQYTQGPDALAQIVRANGLRNPNMVPVGYNLRIPRQLIRYEPSSATVNRINCRNIARVDADPPITLQTGDQLLEGHVVRIPAGCQMSLLLDDQSVMRMMSGAVIKFRTLRRNMLESSPEVRVELLDGRLEVDVPRKRQKGDAPFEVRTPTSVAGVRGTEFRVAFDARKRNSQGEVLSGVVSAQGAADRQAQQAPGGQGVPVLSDGKALPLEKLLDAPVFVEGAPDTAKSSWVLQFRAPEQAGSLLVRYSEDASFSFLTREQTLKQPALSLDNPGHQAVFQQWSSVSPTGIVGYSAYYGFCKGYQRKDAWRCNIFFNMAGLNNPHVQLKKIGDANQEQVVLDQTVKLADNDQLVFRGLPSGRYRWQIEYAVGAGRSQRQGGEFQLVALPTQP